MFCVHVGRKNVPHRRCGVGEGPPTPCCLDPRDLEEVVTHYRSYSTLTLPPRDVKGGKVSSVLHLGLVQHHESINTPPVL